MNPIVDNFSRILEFAKEYGLPEFKKRGILREFLQVKILDHLYRKKISSQLYFIGGTSLRLLRNLDRFSEDLDFDLGEKIGFDDVASLMDSLVGELKKENINVEIYQNKTGKRIYFELKFLELLGQLNLSQNKGEKLAIKFDFENYWQGEKREVILLNRYGFLVNIITIDINQILTQKIYAYLQRKQTLARDLYDIVWLIGQQGKIDWNFVKKNHLPKNIVEKAIEKFENERKKINLLKRKLIPFLINEENINKINLFPDLLERII